MAQHQFTTPRVVYLGQAHPGRDDRKSRAAARATSSSPRTEHGRLIARRAAISSQAATR